MSPNRITPPTRTGGDVAFQKSMRALTGYIMFMIGMGIFIFVAAIIVLELVLNPIFLYSQQEAAGATIGYPNSLSWWTPIGISIATTGTQYALLQKRPKSMKRRLGVLVGWAIAVLDTGMDIGGYDAWVNGGNLTDLNGNSQGLLMGFLPPESATAFDWTAMAFIAGACLLHERFLSVVLGRLTFNAPDDAHGGVKAQAKLVSGAGHLHNKTKSLTMTIAPFVMMFLDIMLFAQNGVGSNNAVSAVMAWVITVMVTLLGMVTYDYYNHLRNEDSDQYKLTKLDNEHRMIFMVAAAITLVDSFFDLKGFNQSLYDQNVAIPDGAGFPWFLTTALVLIMCTFNEPMAAELFVPLEMAHVFKPGSSAPVGPLGLSRFGSSLLDDDSPSSGSSGLGGGLGGSDGLGGLTGGFGGGPGGFGGSTDNVINIFGKKNDDDDGPGGPGAA